MDRLVYYDNILILWYYFDTTQYMFSNRKIFLKIMLRECFQLIPTMVEV